MFYFMTQPQFSKVLRLGEALGAAWALEPKVKWLEGQDINPSVVLVREVMASIANFHKPTRHLTPDHTRLGIKQDPALGAVVAYATNSGTTRWMVGAGGEVRFTIKDDRKNSLTGQVTASGEVTLAKTPNMPLHGAHIMTAWKILNAVAETSEIFRALNSAGVELAE